jgi:hypothetical protein
MSTMFAPLPPMDAERRRQRREEVRALTESVRTHSAAGTWSQPDADLALIELERHVDGMRRHLAEVLAPYFHEDAWVVLEGTLDGKLAQEHMELVLRVLVECKRDMLAAELMELHLLVGVAREELDRVITAPRLAEDQSPLDRAVAEIIAAEHAGDLWRAKQLSGALTGDGEHHLNGANEVLERARRDQKREIALGRIDPPYRNWRQRVMEALRGTPSTTPY